MNIFQNILDEQLNNSPDNEREPEREVNEFLEYEQIRTLDDKKTIAQTKKIDIENEKAIGSLIERKMIQAIIEEVGHGIQTSFIDFSRRESPLIAALLGVPEKEMQLSEILSEKIKVSIDSVVSITEKYSKDEFYE